MSVDSDTSGAIVLSPDKLRRLQLTQLELLIEFDRICRKHQISYILDGGTLLGAVRHKGFIPWDDDIDVSMLRSDYERFCAVCIQELDQKRFFWQTHETDPEYRWAYGKLLYKGTVFVRLHQEHLKMKQFIFIDVFPFDGVPDNPFLRKIHACSCTVLQKACWSVVGQYHASNLFMRGLYYLISHISIERIHACFRYLQHKCNEQNHQWIRILGYDDIKRLSKSFYIDLREIVFEGHLFLAPRDADGWLRSVYGDDYMELPLKEKRVGTAVASKISWEEE